MLEKLRNLRSQIEAREALLCLPAFALILLAGVATDHPGTALIASTGALSVGFGSFQRFTRHRSAPMLLAALGMAISAGVGSWMGRSEAALLVVSTLWAAGCAWLMAFSPGAWWIVLQWAIALFVAGAYPADLAHACSRSGLVLLGGALQLGSIAALWHLLEATAAPRRIGDWRSYLRLARRIMRGIHHPLAYAAQAGCAVAVTVAIERAARLPNGYWAPMTALIVIKPGFRDTWVRVLDRTLGTMAGAGVATLAAALLRPNIGMTAVLVLVFAWCAFALRAAWYALFSASITACIVFLLSLAGLPEPLAALHRILATLLGAAVALGVVAAGALVLAARERLTLTLPPQGP
jgi:hypothetical protein